MPGIINQTRAVDIILNVISPDSYAMLQRETNEERKERIIKKIKYRNRRIS
jgi:hypothetical protein